MTWTSHLEKMLHDLSAHPESLEDEVLVAMVRNCRISDDILTPTLGRYEPETGGRQAAPPILHVKALQMRLDNIKATTRSEVLARSESSYLLGICMALTKRQKVYKSK